MTIPLSRRRVQRANAKTNAWVYMLFGTALFAVAFLTTHDAIVLQGADLETIEFTAGFWESIVVSNVGMLIAVIGWNMREYRRKFHA